MALNITTVSPLVSALNNTTSPTASTQPAGSLMMGLIIEFVVLLIFLGNLAILIVLKLYKPLNIPDVLVLSLALSDFLNVSFPVQILNLTTNILKIPYTEKLCIVYVWATYTFRMASVLTVSVICADRWLAILKPLYYRSNVIGEVLKVKIIIACLWFLAAVIALPPHIGLGSTGYKDGTCLYQLVDLGLGYGILIEILGLAQLALVLYCYISIKISTTSFLRRQKKMRGSNDTEIFKEKPKKSSLAAFGKRSVDKKLSTSGQNAPSFLHHKSSVPSLPSTVSQLVITGQPKRNLTDGERQVTKIEKMMAIVVLLYYITWLPFLITNLFSLITGRSNSLAVTIVGFFSLINGLLNPIVYGTLNLRYRKGYSYIFRKILSCCGGRAPEITLDDFDESRRRTKRNLQNVQKMRSISTSEHSSVRSRGYTWSSSSATSSLSGDPEHDSLNLKNSIGNNNNHHFDDLKTHLSRITIVEEPELDDPFEQSKEDIDADTSDVTHGTDCTNPDAESAEQSNEMDENKEDPPAPRSPPVIMSYRLSSSLDYYVNQYHNKRSLSTDSSVQEDEEESKCVDNDEVQDDVMQHGVQKNDKDIYKGGMDDVCESSSIKDSYVTISPSSNGLEIGPVQGEGITNVILVNEEQENHEETFSLDISNVEGAFIKRRSNSELILDKKEDTSITHTEVSRPIKRSATMPSKDPRKSSLSRNDDLESLLDRCIELKNQYYSPNRRTCRRVLSHGSGGENITGTKEELKTTELVRSNLDNLAFEPDCISEVKTAL